MVEYCGKNEKIGYWISKINGVKSVIFPSHGLTMQNEVFDFYDDWYRKHRAESYKKIDIIFTVHFVDYQVKEWEDAYNEVVKLSEEWELYKKKELIKEKKKALSRDFR